jgi:hypothetical protein
VQLIEMNDPQVPPEFFQPSQTLFAKKTGLRLVRVLLLDVQAPEMIEKFPLCYLAVAEAAPDLGTGVQANFLLAGDKCADVVLLLHVFDEKAVPGPRFAAALAPEFIFFAFRPFFSVAQFNCSRCAGGWGGLSFAFAAGVAFCWRCLASLPLFLWVMTWNKESLVIIPNLTTAHESCFQNVFL